MAERSLNILKECVEDLAKCAICNELFEQPRQLPCLHTFCLRCLKRYCDSEDVLSAEELKCPVCRKPFTIPSDGPERLPHDFKAFRLTEAGRQLERSLRDEQIRSRIRQEPSESTAALEDADADDDDVDVVEVLTARIDASCELMKRLEAGRQAVELNVVEMERLVRRRGDEVKRLVDDNVEALIKDLDEFKVAASVELDGRQLKLRSELKETLKRLHGHRDASSEGQTSDALLQRRVNDDPVVDATDSQHNSCPTFYVEFVPDDDCVVNVGSLRTLRMQEDPRSVYASVDGEPIGGLATLDNELYVLRPGDINTVEVYDITATSYSLRRRLTVPELEELADMTSCEQHRCLYIADLSKQCVHRLEPNRKGFLRRRVTGRTSWSVGDAPWGLSVTPVLTVLVTCFRAGLLREFFMRGESARVIHLSADIATWHAVSTGLDGGGHFVVCHGGKDDPVHRVCLVDAAGRVDRSYGGPKGSATVGQLEVPGRLAVDVDGFVFVADVANRRVLLLSPSLGYVRQVATVDGPNRRPSMLLVDTERKLLYVANNEFGRFKTYDAGKFSVFRLHSA